MGVKTCRFSAVAARATSAAPANICQLAIAFAFFQPRRRHIPVASSKRPVGTGARDLRRPLRSPPLRVSLLVVDLAALCCANPKLSCHGLRSPPSPVARGPPEFSKSLTLAPAGAGRQRKKGGETGREVRPIL